MMISVRVSMRHLCLRSTKRPKYQKKSAPRLRFIGVLLMAWKLKLSC